MMQIRHSRNFECYTLAAAALSGRDKIGRIIPDALRSLHHISKLLKKDSKVFLKCLPVHFIDISYSRLGQFLLFLLAVVKRVPELVEVVLWERW